MCVCACMHDKMTTQMTSPLISQCLNAIYRLDINGYQDINGYKWIRCYKRWDL